MPIRRASAASHVQGSSATRVHRTNGSNYSVSGPSLHPSGMNVHNPAPATPQQKVISILVTRLKNKLPCNAGTSLTELEDDPIIHGTIEALVELAVDSLDIIAWALTELLDKLARQNYRSIDVMQSQLFILKVLVIAMASRYASSTEDTRPSSRIGKGSSEPNSLSSQPNSPAPSTQQRGRQPSYEKMSVLSSATSTRRDVPSLDDNCARYVLSVMILFIRQTAPTKGRLMSAANLNFNASYHDFESVESQDGHRHYDNPLPVSSEAPSKSLLPRGLHELKRTRSDIHSVNSRSIEQPLYSTTYEKTSTVVSDSMQSMNALIAKFSGRAIHHLSQSNWSVVFQRIRQKIHTLAGTSEEEPDITDLHLLMHCALDRIRLVQSLQELSSLLVNMRKEAQVALAVPLRSAVWNWIESYPEEFNDLVYSLRKLDGAPERVFDILFALHDNASADKSAVWPALTVLMCISSDRIKSEYETAAPNSRGPGRKERNFAEAIIRAMNQSSRTTEIAMICALDICRTASRVAPQEGIHDVPLLTIAREIASDVRTRLMKWVEGYGFWMSRDDIDVGLMGDALVTIYRFLDQEKTIELFERCLEPQQSDAVKICVIKALITLISEVKLIPWQTPLEDLRMTVAERVASIYRHSVMHRSEVDDMGNIRKPNARPKARRYVQETVTDRELLSLACLALYRADINWYLCALHMDQKPYWIPGTVELWLAPSDPSVKVSMNRTTRHALDVIIEMSPEHPWWIHCAGWMTSVMPATLAAVCLNLLDARTDFKMQQMYMSMAVEIMERFTKPLPPHLREVQNTNERIPAFLLAEVAFLVSLTSADRNVSAMACQCLRLLALAERQPDAPEMSALDNTERVKRYPVYDQLGADQKSVLGRIAHQKRIRKLMRSLSLPVPMHMAVWQECYFRWCTLDEMSLRAIADDQGPLPTGDRSLTNEERQYQWQNLTLFMASFGPVIPGKEDPPSFSKLVGEWYLPDQFRVMRNPADLLAIFLGNVTNLLIDEAPQVRDVAREALGNELNPRLYTRILRELESVLNQVIDGNPSGLEQLGVFLEQCIPIFTVIADNIKSLQDAPGVDMSPTLRTLATLIGRYTRGTAYRLKLKFCILLTFVYDSTTATSVGKDNDVRQAIADQIIEWALDPASVEEEFSRTQRDLNLEILKAAVKLFDHLALAPPEDTSEEDYMHYTSRLFMRYVHFLLKVLEFSLTDPMREDGMSDQSQLSHLRTMHQMDGEFRDLTIQGLAELISANTDFGIKHCLPLAYDQDIIKQTVFTHAFAQVLQQGIKLDPRESTGGSSKQSKLAELMKGPDPSLALAVCEVCPASKVEQMIRVLLDVFDTRASLVNLLKAMIDREIARTDSETSLFRGNSIYNRFMSACARRYGYNYIRSIINPLEKAMAEMPPDHSYEIDPAKVGEEAAAKNQKVVELIAKSFLSIIASSVPAFPAMFREICAYIVYKVSARWPQSKFSALGAFIFLRFISPCVVSPSTVDIDVPLTPSLIAGRKTIAKIVQNLANNIKFGKEAHMVSLNNFLGENIKGVTAFLSEIQRYVPPGPEEDHDQNLETQYDESDTIILQRFFVEHVDKIGKELLSSPKAPEDTALDGDATSKDSWQAICSAIYENNIHSEMPFPAPETTDHHAPYKELLDRFKHRDTTAVQHLFVDVHVVKHPHTVFLLSVSKIDIEVLDLELLLYYILKTLMTPTYVNRTFEIIFDFTQFGPASSIPLQWIKWAYHVIPSDIRERFKMSRLLTPNTLALRYLRKLTALSGNASFGDDYAIYSSVRELLTEYAANGPISALMDTYMQEEEPRDTFDDITMRICQTMRVPVILDIARSHLRITVVRTHSLSNWREYRPTEIIPYQDISDAYNISTGQDANEFVIRKARQGSTLYFSSPYRDAIVKTIRVAKGNIKSAQLPVPERASKLSSVVATLTHLGFIHVGSNDDDLRMAAYDLCIAVCIYLGFEGRPLIPAKSAFIPSHPGPYQAWHSGSLSAFAPQLTLDFIAAVASIGNPATSQKIDCIQYLSPWIKNISLFMDPCHDLYDPSGAKVRDAIRTLIEFTFADLSVYSVFQKYIWGEIAKLESHVVTAVLDELMRAAVDGGLNSPRCETIADIMSVLTSINVRGRIFARLRKALGKTSTKPTKDLSDNPHWNEIACLTRLCTCANYRPRNLVHSQLFAPETAHLVALVAGTGDIVVRSSVFGMIANLVQAVYQAHSDSGGQPSAELRGIIQECTESSTLKAFGLLRPKPGSDFVPFTPNNDSTQIELLETLNNFLGRMLKAIAGNNSLHNSWKARWMSLITSSAFQLSPAIQTRAFISMGTLATSDVDDDLMYQMLVAFKTALSQFNEKESLAVTSMLRCMHRVVPALPFQSRYLTQLFWLAVALLQSGHMVVYLEAIQLLRATLERMDRDKMFDARGVAATLVDARAPVDDIAEQIDKLLSLSFAQSFSFSLAAIIFKGVRHTAFYGQTELTLRSLLRVTVAHCGEPHANGHTNDRPGSPVCGEALGYFLALISISTTPASYRELLTDAKVPRSWQSEELLPTELDLDETVRVPLGLLGVEDPDTALLVASLASAMLQTAQGDDKETQILYGILSDMAEVFPEVVATAFDSFQEKVKEAFANSSRPMIISHVSNIFRVATHEAIRSPLRGQHSASTLSTVEEASGTMSRKHYVELEQYNMSGLANAFTFVSANNSQNAAKMINWISELVMRIID
ncbi:hypothetical protein K474DRAFT_1717515 [Panus rudis PR-1116 ss-1]|nr:hypothetical protein K474DRAFT_1717515 [Panus rudis PR-1116 ss-1]